jgi:hypothetical protein
MFKAFRVAWVLLIVVVVAGCPDTTPPAPIITSPKRVETNATTPDLTGADIAEARRRADRAIAAHGGAANLIKTRNMHVTTKGIFHSQGSDAICQEEWHLQFPERARMRVDFLATKQTIHQILNGKDGWSMSLGIVTQLTDTQLSAARNEVYLLDIAYGLGLKEKQIALRPIDEIKVDEKPLFGIQVSAKDMPTLNLYFDKQSSLLTRISSRWTEAFVTFTREISFSGHRDFGGVVLPTKKLETRSNGKFLEWTQAEYSFPPRFEDAIFRP